MDDIEQIEATSEELDTSPVVEQSQSTRDVLEAAFNKVDEQDEEPAPVEREEPDNEGANPDIKAAKPEDTKKSRAPKSWSPAVRERFNALDPDVQKEIVKRETEMSSKLSKTATERRVAGDYFLTMQPYNQFLAERKMHPMEYTKQALQITHGLTTGTPAQKAQHFAKLAKSINLDFKEFDTAMETVYGAPSIDPALDERLRRIEQFTGNQQQQVATQQHQDVNSTIEKFMTDPKNEFAKDVVPQMQALLTSGQANDLQAAYDQAVWMNTETRKVMLQRETGNKARLNAGNGTLRNGGPRATGSPASVKGNSTRAVLENLIPRDAFGG